jgi:hypothetical protein
MARDNRELSETFLGTTTLNFRSRAGFVSDSSTCIQLFNDTQRDNDACQF